MIFLDLPNRTNTRTNFDLEGGGGEGEVHKLGIIAVCNGVGAPFHENK